MPDPSPVPGGGPDPQDRAPGGAVLRIGFVPLVDCAPLAVAQELGYFHAEGVRVRPLRQPGWASVRDKLLFNELDGAHAPAGLVFAINSGLGSIQSRCLAAFVLNHQGNAITLSQRLHERGVRDRGDLLSEARARARYQPLTFGVVSRHSTHHHLLRQWLMDGGLRPGQDARIVIQPPQQMARGLEAGYLDGFCAGEPWDTLSVRRGLGWIAATSTELAPAHPEKVLAVRENIPFQRPAEHRSLLRALHRAAAWCDRPENRPELARILGAPAWLDLPADLLEASLRGPDFIQFHRPDVNEPTLEKARWLVGEMTRHELLPASTRPGDDSLVRSFRPDLYHAALE